jgi:hypothetical protein
VLECRSVGVSESRSVGVSECRSVGVVECWNIRVLSVGVPERWCLDVLEWCSVGALQCHSEIVVNSPVTGLTISSSYRWDRVRGASELKKETFAGTFAGM